MKNEISVQLSNHHVHLSVEDMKAIYGDDYEYTNVKQLGPTNFVTDVTATVSGPKGSISGLKVLGPNRKLTQVELLRGDTFKLGVKPPVCESADPETAAEVTITGPKGSVTKKCAIVAQRHIHIGNEIIEDYGLSPNQLVSLETEGERGVVFKNTLVRMGKGNKCVVHIDTEEGNAAGLKNGDIVKIVL